MTAYSVATGSAKEKTMELIAEYAPNELVVSELMWDEYNTHKSPIDLDNKDTFLGAGLEIAGISLLSTIIIPVVLAALEQIAKRSADVIFDAIQARAKTTDINFSDDEIRRIAEKIVQITASTTAPHT